MKKLLTLAIATVFGLSSTLALAASNATNVAAQNQTTQTTQAAKQAKHHKQVTAKKSNKHATQHVKAKSADSKKSS